jgi:hypothetical protein
MQVVGTKITDLAAGIYEVRYAAKEDYIAGETTEVMVAPYIVQGEQSLIYEDS